MGDLIATCMSPHSRNRAVGEQLGKGRRLEDILAEMHMVAEGREDGHGGARAGRAPRARPADLHGDRPGGAGGDRAGRGLLGPHPRRARERARLSPAGSSAGRRREGTRPAAGHGPDDVVLVGPPAATRSPGRASAAEPDGIRAGPGGCRAAAENATAGWNLPLAELPLDLSLVAPGRGQTSRQPRGPPPHLLRLGQALLGEPPPVTASAAVRAGGSGGGGGGAGCGCGRPARPGPCGRASSKVQSRCSARRNGEFLPIRSPSPRHLAVSARSMSNPSRRTSRP